MAYLRKDSVPWAMGCESGPWVWAVGVGRGCGSGPWVWAVAVGGGYGPWPWTWAMGCGEQRQSWREAQELSATWVFYSRSHPHLPTFPPLTFCNFQAVTFRTGFPDEEQNLREV